VGEASFIAVIIGLMYAFIPNSVDPDKIKEKAGPDRGEYLSLSEFTERYGTPEERAELARESREETEQETAKQEEEREETVQEEPWTMY
jgi:hypothetical protein